MLGDDVILHAVKKWNRDNEGNSVTLGNARELNGGKIVISQLYIEYNHFYPLFNSLAYTSPSLFLNTLLNFSYFVQYDVTSFVLTVCPQFAC